MTEPALPLPRVAVVHGVGAVVGIGELVLAAPRSVRTRHRGARTGGPRQPPSRPRPASRRWSCSTSLIPSARSQGKPRRGDDVPRWKGGTGRPHRRRKWSAGSIVRRASLGQITQRRVLPQAGISSVEAVTVDSPDDLVAAVERLGPLRPNDSALHPGAECGTRLGRPSPFQPRSSVSQVSTAGAIMRPNWAPVEWAA